jgi:hypothetical protein
LFDLVPYDPETEVVEVVIHLVISSPCISTTSPPSILVISQNDRNEKSAKNLHNHAIIVREMCWGKEREEGE